MRVNWVLQCSVRRVIGGLFFELERCFGYRSFPHAVMVTSRQGSWQDGSKDSKGDMLFVLQMQPSVPEKSLGGED